MGAGEGYKNYAHDYRGHWPPASPKIEAMPFVKVIRAKWLQNSRIFILHGLASSDQPQRGSCIVPAIVSALIRQINLRECEEEKQEQAFKLCTRECTWYILPNPYKLKIDAMFTSINVHLANHNQFIMAVYSHIEGMCAQPHSHCKKNEIWISQQMVLNIKTLDLDLRNQLIETNHLIHNRMQHSRNALFCPSSLTLICILYFFQ